MHLVGGFSGPTETSTPGTLVEVNNRGIVLLSDNMAETFIPWSAVATLARSHAGEAATQEQQNPHLGARIGGPTSPGGSPNKP